MAYGRGGQKGSYVRGLPQEKYKANFIKVHRTNDAILLKLAGQQDDEAEWVPFSQIDRVSDVDVATGEVEVVMSAWIAKKKGFIS